jgi:hypothetical protein
MRLSVLILLAMFLPSLSVGQHKIDPSIAALDNYSISRTGHKNVGFKVDDRILKRVRRHKSRYSKYLYEQLQDTSKTIVAHLLLTNITWDTLSVLEKGFTNDETGRPGFYYELSGLAFKKYFNGRYVVDVNSMRDIRNKWIEILGEQ